ncbi:MAG: type II CRISPR RNA-guided endonuclease Cas9 [Bacteroidales bacterium]|jgi:CRISPR-associated endonuclease Csn1|nr:type II CRISPR RNA-guided endonuclease Cas9 [Bacteroidales bacterium]MBP7874765.1 type II CRISPR RNA-guided endonuclease Cas9 [Bacteroidales bacterium]MCZ2283532.1 type II CRISPR RNA-guided endonuclease Cas9 [Bacteroidales bacterium]
MKKILGLDLGTNSIGWALVNEAENENEKSSIIMLGVRVNPLTVDEQKNFEKGKSITTNADRTMKRGKRRNLQRYKLRRENLIEILKENGFITDEPILSENGNYTTFETYRLRAKAVTEEITLEQFARVLLMINKKRGYKSNRKAKGAEEEGVLIDGMEVAKLLYEKDLTPGQYCLQLMEQGKKQLPEFYRSDLQEEFNRIWAKQQEFYSEILTDKLKENLREKSEKATWTICKEPFNIVGIPRTTKGEELKKENFAWRTKALSEKLDLESLAVVLQKINGQINNSSGYLGAISDRSKELYFNKQTVGQYQMAVLAQNPNASLKNMVFYRQDYLDEFNIIWEKQAEFHKKELTEELKKEIRDVIIFYQRRLKSQKGLIGFCEFESRQIEVEIDGKKKIKTVGSRVIPRSSPLFQEFKIWQTLNNLEVSGKGRKSKKKKEHSLSLFTNQEDPLLIYGKRELYQEEKELLATELSIKEKLTKSDILKLLFDNPQELDLNFKEVQGNLTQAKLFAAYRDIIEQTGHILDLKKSASEILENVEQIFSGLGYNTDIIRFNSDTDNLDNDPMYKLWHLLYSFEGDNSKTGNENLINKITNLYGFEKEYAAILANITFQDDYGSLSAKAIRKIFPYLKEGNKYDISCEYAGYRHSASSLTKEELENMIYKDRLEILPKNSLRNPVVEKILNQMVHVVNAIIADPQLGKPDEIRIELARELKKNAKERQELTKSIEESTRMHKQYREILSKPPFNLTYISRNDIIRYKLYEELKDNGYHTLYSNTYISPTTLFSGDFDVEHIIPQSRLFDDSFSNKTLELRSINIEKGNATACDFVKEKYGETNNENSMENYLNRIEKLYKTGVLSRAKYNKLKMQEKDIPSGFIERDIRNTQYIAKYAKTMLSDLVKVVVSTTGAITDRLREDWQLIDVMKELNWEKYKNLGLTTEFTNEEGYRIRQINDWTKRNDHRHHAMDALTVAFTKRQFIQYLNNLNARRTDKNQSISNTEEEEYDNFAITTEDMLLNTRDVLGIEKNYLYRDHRNKLRFYPPIPLNDFRAEAKYHLENTLISIKAKNKVTTQNINFTKRKRGVNKKTQQTPRGQLHLETVYGSQKQYVVKEESVNAKFDAEKIATVSKPAYREALLRRLQEFDNDPKKAFTGKNSLTKNPIWLNKLQTAQVPEKVKTISFETAYTIRKEISPDLKLDKVIDLGIRRILENRLKEFRNDAKKAFSNLDENPIRPNKEKGIAIKRVTISGISNAEALHDKRDKEGNLILDKNGKPQPVDFVNTGNNHHVAVYRKPVFDKDGNHAEDENGNKKYELEENVVSFYEAVSRRNLGLPVIDKAYKASEGWQFLFSMKQNEYFVFPRTEKVEKIDEETGEITEEEIVVFDPNDIDLLNPDNYKLISPNLFRVQKFSKLIYGNSVVREYVFRHHLETSIKNTSSVLKGITWIDFRSSKGLDKIVKVRVNHIGKIVSVGEY